MAYSWGSQKTDVALETATDLKEVFSQGAEPEMSRIRSASG
jgi:hypothetical protein